jgi:hypothetical protein
MSKQIKLKFKKMLKKAEFVHADLEYHTELFEDAKVEFNKAFSEIVQSLSGEEAIEFGKLKDELMQKRIADLEKRLNEAEEAQSADLPVEDPKNENSELLVTEEFPEGIELNVDLNEDVSTEKASEMKKLFYKIASLTHPDKLASSNLSKEEILRSEQTFKKAKDAYENGNWYILYSIALELDVPDVEAGERHIEWMENDIRHTMGRIAHLAQLAAWAWYTRDEQGKISLMKGYFKQVYNFDWTPPTDSP